MSNPTRHPFFMHLVAAVFVAACSSDSDEAPAETLTPIRIALTGDSTYPEGIVVASNGTFYVGGFGDGSIQRIDAANNVSVFRAAGADQRGAAVGMVLDEGRGRLWVARFNFPTTSSALQAFDPNTGALLMELTPTNFTDPHFFNEVALAADGRIFISDTLGPRIWVADPAANKVEVFVENPVFSNSFGQQFGLNGLALAPGGEWLIASVMDRIDQGDGILVRIDVATKQVSKVKIRGEAVLEFGGSDGMFFMPDGELLMVNVTPPSTLVTAKFDPNYATADLTNRPAFDGFLKRSTSSVLRGGQSLFVVNSQLDHIIDDQNGALGTPPKLPFEIVGAPIDKLLESGSR